MTQYPNWIDNTTYATSNYVYTLTTDTSYSSGQLALTPAPPKVLTEVERLMSDVDAVCALAR